MKKSIVLVIVTSVYILLSSCATTIEKPSPSNGFQLPEKATPRAESSEQKPQSPPLHQVTKGDIFVISNRNGTIKSDCSGLGDRLGSSFTYLTANINDTSCEAHKFESNEQGFLSTMNAWIKESNRPLVIFIHGSGQGFKTALKKAKEFSIVSDSNVLSLDWPVGETTGDYTITIQRAGDSGKAFVPILKQVFEVLNSGKTSSVDFFAHSMGNYVLQKLVENSEKSVFKNVDRTIINAPDVMLNNHKDWVNILASDTANKVYVVINQKDQVITCSAGEGGLGPFRRIACGTLVTNKITGTRLGNSIPQSDFAKGTTYLDVTKIKGVKRKHEYYLGSPKKLEVLYKELLDESHEPNFIDLPHNKQNDNKVIRFK